MPFVATTFPEFYLATGVNRQAIDNGDFLVWQRGMDVEPTIYVGEPDRWHFGTDSTEGSFRFRRVSIGIEDRPKETHTDSAIEIECLDEGTLGFTADLRQKHYDAHYGAGEAVSVAVGIKPMMRDFVARFIMKQHFGPAGSPDVIIQDVLGHSVYKDQWSRLEYVFDMPSVEGKTFDPDGGDFIQTTVRLAAMLTGEKVRMTGVQMNLGGRVLPFYSRGVGEETTRALAHRERVVGLGIGYFATGVMVSPTSGLFMFPLTYKIIPSTDIFHTGMETFELHVGGTVNPITEISSFGTYPGMSFVRFRSAELTRTIGEGCVLNTKVAGAGLDFGRDY